MSETTEVPLLSVDGVSYPVNELPSDIQELINVYQIWEGDLKKQKVEVFKIEAAMRAVSAEIQSRVRQMANSDPDFPEDEPELAPEEGEEPDTSA